MMTNSTHIRIIAELRDQLRDLQNIIVDQRAEIAGLKRAVDDAETERNQAIESREHGSYEL